MAISCRFPAIMPPCTIRSSMPPPVARLPLDVHCIHTLPVLGGSCHSREDGSGNPGDGRHGDWMPACAGMTFYWRRTYETDIETLTYMLALCELVLPSQPGSFSFRAPCRSVFSLPLDGGGRGWG